MALYSLANLTTNVTTANAALELIAASTDRVKVMEIGITQNAATATTIGLGRPAAVGITPTSPIALLSEENTTDVATSKTALAWGTGPTAPTNFMRRIAFPATLGAGIVWSWKNGLVIPVSGSLVLWNIVGGSALNVWIVVDE